MHCPFCAQAETKVLDSRPGQDHKSIRRRRECLSCAKRWRTCERIEDEMPMVLKKNGTHQPFDREKLLSSIRVACSKRPVSLRDIDEAVAEIEWKILEQGGKSVSSIAIGEQVMTALKKLDEIAYVRYASVYRRFKDVGELLSELQGLVAGPTGDISKGDPNKNLPPATPTLADA